MRNRLSNQPRRFCAAASDAILEMKGRDPQHCKILMDGMPKAIQHFAHQLKIKIWLPVALTLLFLGCTSEPQFRLNSVHKLTLEKEFQDGDPFPEAHIEQVGNLVTAFFGTPDAPHFPAGYETLVDAKHLQRAAGPVSSDLSTGQGLYRQHCAHCHGITGDGAGPTAASLNPYPRDFRLGKFKFKSTRMYRPPTDEDIRRILERGIAGSAMPSFALLPADQIDALVDYVKYLSIRGQVERVLLEELTNLEEGEDLLPPKTEENQEDYEYALELIMELVDPVLSKWENPDAKVVPLNGFPKDFKRRLSLYSDAGKKLFFGKANCVQCHGETGIGDGQTENYDDWTNEWLKRANVDPNKPEQVNPFLQAGALPPRKIRPRNLRDLVFRGGSHPNDLYRRVKAGIEGSNMPAAPALSDVEIWSLVAYLIELPYQSIIKKD